MNDATEELPKKLPHQMSFIRETDEVIKFLETISEKGVIPPSQAHVKISACHALFSILTEGEESTDYILTHLDVLFMRYRNKFPQVQANTIKVYKSRVKSSVQEYKAFCRDPIGFERSLHEKKRIHLQKDKVEKPVSIGRKKIPYLVPHDSSDYDERKVSFPIRPDFNLEMVLPADGLSLKELLRLGLFLYPYVKEITVGQAASALSGIENLL